MEKYSISKQGLQVTDAELEVTEIVLKPTHTPAVMGEDWKEIEPARDYIEMRYRTQFIKDNQAVPYPHAMDLHYTEISRSRWDELVQLALTNFKNMPEVTAKKII